MIRIVQRAGRGTWVSMGPAGWAAAGVVLLPFWMLWAVFVILPREIYRLYRSIQRLQRWAAHH